MENETNNHLKAKSRQESAIDKDQNQHGSIDNTTDIQSRSDGCWQMKLFLKQLATKVDERSWYQ